MRLNIPQTSTVSHELPIFTQMSNESKIPVSEIKARFRQELIDQHRKALDDPSIMPMGSDASTMVDVAISSLNQKLQHPEETVDDDKEYADLFDLEPGDQDPAAQQFSMDNLSLGFSDDGMKSFERVDNPIDGFGSVQSAGDVNAISAFEPSAPKNDTGDETSDDEQIGEKSPADSDSDINAFEF